MLTRFNGWWRIWIVLSIIWTILASVMHPIDLSALKGKVAFYQLQKDDGSSVILRVKLPGNFTETDAKNLLNDEVFIKMLRKHKDKGFSLNPKEIDWYQELMSEMDSKYSDHRSSLYKIENSPVTHSEPIITDYYDDHAIQYAWKSTRNTLMIIFIPIAAMLLLGLAVAWIYAGFRHG